jgi:N6-adenosine-specific RNA methylase IME4
MKIKPPPELAGRQFQIIYADPAWTYNDKCNAGERGAAFKYPTMTLEELYALREFVDQVAAPDCLLALWHVAPMPLEALMLVAKWGFKIKTMKGFTWHKTTATGKDFFGMGNWTRANSEDCLFAVRGKPKRVNAGVPQIIHAPRREHSRKPDEARDRLVKLMGDVPRLEMFARQATPGWSVWGNETGKFTA